MARLRPPMMRLFAALLVAASAEAPRGSSGDTVALVQVLTSLQTQRGEDGVRLVVKDETGKELHLEARKSTRLGKLVDVVCKRLGLEKEYAKFQHGGRTISTFDTVDEFGLQDEDVIEVTGGRVRNIPKRRDLSKLQSDSPAPTPAEAAVVMTTTAAPQAPAPAPPARQLPIPRLQVGDFTYLNISNGSESQNVANTWAPCSVAGLGSHEHMYNVFFIYAPEGLRQSKDVPAQLLRKVDGRRYAEAIQYYREDAEATGQLAAWVRKRLEAVKAAKDGIVANATTKEDKEKEVYQPGDFMEIRLETDLVGPSSNLSWVPCRLVGNGTRLNSYQVHFLFAPPGHGDITNITRAYLRKIPSLDFAKRSLALKKDLELARQAVEQLAQEASNRRELEEQELKKELLAQQAAERLAQREQEKAKKLAKAKAAAEMKEEEKKARKERELAKKAEEEKEAKRIAQYSFSNGAAVLLKLDKPFDGESNLPGKVVRRGSAELNTYDLHFQWSPEGQQDLTGIPAAYLRPADADEFADLIGKFSGDPVAAQVVFAQASKEAARHLRALAAERRARAAEAAGESAS